MRVYIDTSVLMNIDDFVTNWCVGDEHIIISYYSLVELEGLKNNRDKETAAKARKALRFCEHDEITVLAPEVGTDFWTRRRTRGLPGNNDGKIIRACFADAVSEKQKYKPSFYTYDHAQITLWEGLTLSQKENTFAGYLLTLPQKDENKPEIIDDITTGYGWICAPTVEAIDGLQPNQYALLDNGSIVKETVSGERVPLEYKPVHSLDMGDISPLNPQQEMMFDLLQNKDIKVKLIKGRYGSGKACPNDTLIPTPDGEKRLGEVQVGDFVYDRLGKPTKVLGVYPQGKLDVYKLTFSDGRIALCNNEHIWTTITSKGNFKNRTVQEMLDAGITTSNGSYRYIIPGNMAVFKTEKKFVIHPYIIGAFLGDGCCKERALTISSNDEEIVKKIAHLLGDNVIYKKNSEHNYNWNFGYNGALLHTKEIFKNYENYLLKYSYEKDIPPEYLEGSIEQRYELLRGLLDTDGSIDIKKGRIRFTSTSLALIKSVQKLVWSLGLISGTIRIDKRKEKYTTECCYNISIGCAPTNKPSLFSLSRKVQRAKEIKITKYARYSSNLVIRKIEKLGYQTDMTCIYVDNKEHLFLTENYICTHNTFSLLAHALELVRRGKFDKIVFIRNNIQVKDSKDVGSLPGELNNKLLPYLMPVADHVGGEEGLVRLIEDNIIEPVHLGFLRGRDFQRTLIFCDECENLTKQHVQLILGRVGKGSEVWFAGDARQKDAKAFEENNGMAMLMARLVGNPLFGTVTLVKSERSEVAQLADELD